MINEQPLVSQNNEIAPDCLDTKKTYFEYFLKEKNGSVTHVSKEEFLNAGLGCKFKPKKYNEQGFKINIEENKIIGIFY